MRTRIEWVWEELDDNTARVKVVGGWIVHHDKHALAKKGNNENILCSESMVFIPDHNHQWCILPPVDTTQPQKANIAKDFMPPKKD